MRPRLRILSSALSLVGMGVSAYLLLYKWKLSTSLVCTFGDCEVVNTSPYSEIAGVPVALLGVGGYATLLALNLWDLATRGRWTILSNTAIFLLSLAGLLFSAYLTYIELFVLRAICQWCVVSALTILTIFLVAAWEMVVSRQAVPRVAH